MPVAPTYPGVYIEEIPSGVHTITGVSTSITAFIGYTARGLVNQPVHIFSVADYERAFGGLSVDSPVSYAVRLFFQNGGGEAYVVRVAHGAAAASVTLKNAAAGVLDVTAASPGTWGNNLQIDVDYDTASPANLFNMRITELVADASGQMVVGRTESFRNLSMNDIDPSYVVDAVNGGSQLVTVALSSTLPAAPYPAASSQTGTLAAGDITAVDATHNRLAFTLDGQGPYEITLDNATFGGAFPGVLATVAANIVAKINAVVAPGSVSAPAPGATSFTINSGTTRRSAIHFSNASTNDAAATLKLGQANGGTEIDSAAALRPLQTGTVGGGSLPVTATGSLTIDVKKGSSGTSLKQITVNVWGAPPLPPQPTTLDQLVAQINTAFMGQAPSEPFLVGASAARIGTQVRIALGSADPNLSFDFSGATATTLGLAPGTRNVARYAPGIGVTALGQIAGAGGTNGTAPSATEIIGTESAKTGMFALENVDLFNLLVLPGLLSVRANETGDIAAIGQAIAYCVRRRAFMIIDSPTWLTSSADANAWINSSNAASLRSRNGAIYFPQLRMPDPLKNNVVVSFPAAGALAGLYARTDGDRGVWKAPAGTAANVAGATGLSYTLTDKENGVLNPLGLNCLRTFPVYGTVAWGARTARGADALTDEYKYVPVRRLALFLEESLYRGTQWVVFEPNDEPLWAQIRLNLGAFMHTLFAQGAFQGRTPREAYFVKCDKDTTTQNDIDLGRVNIVVGFAPLKPAEFVIIQIQQIAGAIQT